MDRPPPGEGWSWWPGGTLLVAATPLGNPGDASHRLVAALAGADLVLAEDTRRFRRLAGDLGVPVRARVLSCFEGNERARIAAALGALRDGQRVLLVSDAGTPTISDPGWGLVQAAVAADCPVVALPGPSAVLIALVLSGLPADRFTFEGFLPRAGAQRAERLARIAAASETRILFESPRRTAATLRALLDACGADRPAALVREATKRHEEVRRGTLATLTAHAEAVTVLGEVVVVIGPAAGAGDPDGRRRPVDGSLGRAAGSVVALVAAGADRRTAAREVAALTGLPRTALYNASLSAAAPPAGRSDRPPSPSPSRR